MERRPKFLGDYLSYGDLAVGFMQQNPKDHSLWQILCTGTEEIYFDHAFEKVSRTGRTLLQRLDDIHVLKCSNHFNR